MTVFSGKNWLPVFAWAGLLGLLSAHPGKSQLPQPPVPPENPVTALKAVLGKMLFWDEQMSSDNTVSCGTCHRPELGGADVRRVRLPGLDELPNTPDDVFGSPGVVRSDANNDFLPHSLHGLRPQVTARRTPTVIGAAFFRRLFWDGRSGGRFVDPQTGELQIPRGGTLENQSVQPLISSVEMAHEGRTWEQIIGKLSGIEPLALARNLPADIEDHLGIFPTYPALFEAAFGSSEISATRIAFALATYQRTLVPDETPWDLFQAGDQQALTADQRAGLDLFRGAAGCNRCHTAPLFSDDQFHNIGLRPNQEDLGRQLVTGLERDRGRFKTATLRNAGLRNGFMHNGSLRRLGQVIGFYNRGGDFGDNQDPRINPLGLNQAQRGLLLDFVANGLTDPRVEQGLPPFDRPTLRSELPPNPRRIRQGSEGTGGFIPNIIAGSPPHLPSEGFRLGIGGGLGGANAFIVVSGDSTPPGTTTGTGIPLHVDFGATMHIMESVILSGQGPGNGFGTFKLDIPDSPDLRGRDFFVQWFVQDPNASGGVAATAAARLDLF